MARPFSFPHVLPDMNSQPKGNTHFVILAITLDPKLSKEPPMQGGASDIFRFYMEHFDPQIMIDLGRHYCVPRAMPGLKPRPKANHPFINSCLTKKIKLSKEPPWQGGAFGIFRFYIQHLDPQIMIYLGRHYCVSTVMPGMHPRAKANPLFMNSRHLKNPRLSEEPSF
jgi:hypothetical protein